VLEWYQRDARRMFRNVNQLQREIGPRKIHHRVYKLFTAVFYAAAETGPGWAANLKIVKINELAVKTKTVILRRLSMYGIMYAVKTHIMFYAFKIK